MLARGKPWTFTLSVGIPQFAFQPFGVFAPQREEDAPSFPLGRKAENDLPPVICEPPAPFEYGTGRDTRNVISCMIVRDPIQTSKTVVQHNTITHNRIAHDRA